MLLDALHDRLRGRSSIYKRLSNGVVEARKLTPMAVSPKAKVKLVLTGMLLALRSLPGELRIVIYLEQGPFHLADFSGLQVLAEIYAGDAYPRQALPDTARVIVDAGSHIGASLRFFEQLYPDARIVGLEPDPDTWVTCLYNVRRRPSISVRRAALTGAEGPLTLSRSSAGSWATSAYESDGGDSFVADGVTLDNVIADCGGHIDLLKLDIEGAEWDVLRGCTQLERVDCIVGELHASAGVPADEFLAHLMPEFAIVYDGIERSEPKGTFVALRTAGR